MDELEVRRRLLTDPYRLSAEQQEQLKQDPDSQQFHQDILQLDQQIRQLLSPPVPNTLEHSLLLQQHKYKQQQQKRFYQHLVALAASVAFLAGFALNWSFFLYGSQSLGENSLAHVYHEEPYMQQRMTALSLADVNLKLADFDAQLSASDYNVVFANYCNFRGSRSLHLVLDTEQGLMTVFVVPKENSLSFEAEFHDDKYQGRSIATHKAILVMVSDKAETLQRGEQQVLNSLQFKA
ncbi:DUF3379 family protein [Rheinheimera mesophila]|nr:DUF3379 family protein [Rheinheimera mesophila]KKL00557.1 hypothetical protein SD53_12785 [Rheinheimera mesophila]